MILLDYSQIAISNLFANIGYGHKEKNQLPDVNAMPGEPGSKTVVNEDLIRHMVLNSLRMYHMKFGEKYGPMVVCADNRHYWRKDVFPYYKAGRKKTRDNSGLDWHMIFDSLNKIREEIAEFTPYRVLNVNLAEADDLIGIIAKKEHTTERVLVLSGDKDFVQLQKYKNIDQFAPIQKKFITTGNAVETLREHIMIGDAGDGIPNFKSADNSLADGIRQTSIAKKDLARWVKESKPENFCDIKMLTGYRRNQQLIDLDFIPKDLQKAIVDAWETPHKESRKNLLNYFIKFKLSLLLDHIGEF
jgi:hypothetical protein